MTPRDLIHAPGAGLLALRHVWGRRRLDRRLRALYAGWVRAGDVVFDVGANVGDFTRVFLGLGARVVAVEPQEACVAELRRRFGATDAVKVVPRGVGEADGEQPIFEGTASTITSMAPAWIEATRRSGRFADQHWAQRGTVPVTTLDALVEEHGVPAFCKIDVEGYESEVVRGLSRPLRALSFEFTPEYLRGSRLAIEHLEGLGPVRFSHAVWRPAPLVPMPGPLAEWVEGAELKRRLSALPSDVFGDVYARFGG